MKIDHVAIYVKDLEAVKEFYITYFGATAKSKYHNPKTGLETYFLAFDGEERLEIMARPELPENQKNALQYGYSHVSFRVGSKQKVDELTHRLKSDGYLVVSGPRTTGDGYYESCVLDSENNQIEIVE